MKSTDVAGYTADASVWCPDCAVEKYGAAACGLCPDCGAFIFPETGDHCHECMFDYSKCGMTDDEGNPIHAVFAGDEWDYQPCCDGCGEEISVTVLQIEEV